MSNYDQFKRGRSADMILFDVYDVVVFDGDGGILGGADDKDFILNQELVNHRSSSRRLSIGGRQYYYEAAAIASLVFIFLPNWNEFFNDQTYIKNDNIKCINKLLGLMVSDA